MKKILLGILFIPFICVYSDNDDNIYVNTLSHFFEEVIKEKAKANLSDTKEGKIYFKKATGITDAFPDSINGYRIVIIDEKEDNRMLEKKDRITLYYMFPLIIYKGKFWVEILDATYIPSKKKYLYLNISYAEAAHVFGYNYNCKKKSFVFDIYVAGSYDGPTP